MAMSKYDGNTGAYMLSSCRNGQVSCNSARKGPLCCYSSISHIAGLQILNVLMLILIVKAINPTLVPLTPVFTDNYAI